MPAVSPLEVDTDLYGFKWVKERRIRHPDESVQLYESFILNGQQYSLYDSVYLHKEGDDLPYVGKLVRIWEDKKNKDKKIKVLWFFRPNEVENWTRDQKTRDNELFLASGKGVGLTNTNPLEALCGTCNVICISKDKRNPQPSPVDVENADFVFYRTFDVGNLVISDKIEDRIAGVEAKLLFNKRDQRNVTETFRVSVSDQNGHGNMLVGDEGMQSTGINLQLGTGTGSYLNKALQGLTQVKSDSNDISSPKFHQNESEIFASEHEGDFGRSSNTLDAETSQVHVEESQTVDKNLKRDVLDSVDEGCAEEEGKPVKLDSPSHRPLKRIKTEETVATKIMERKEAPVKIEKPDQDTDSKIALSDACACDPKKSTEVFHGKGRKEPTKHLAVKDKRFSDKVIKSTSAAEHVEKKSSKTDDPAVEVTKRPEADKSKWFKRLSWEERIKTAQEQGSLVFLDNLDPSCTAAEIQDILCQGFEERCEAKLVPQTFPSCPHRGGALVIFKTREAASQAIKRLEESCLMLPGGRPLVAGRRSFFAGVAEKYVGHLHIERLRGANREEWKKAVSTSHCSQPNTLEWDMAMEWRLVQGRFDDCWKNLYKGQADVLENLRSKLTRI